MFLCFYIDIVHSRVYGEENAGLINGKSSLISFMSGIVSDPENALESWKSTGVYVCDWSGVRCNNASDRIIELDLSGKSLGGTISPALANLSSLQILDLSGNFFVGHIPKELGYLVQLGQLSLSGNFLEGNIPSEFGSLQNLYYLDMGSNQLKGEIPPSLFCNVTSLSYIDLSNNSLGGQIPLNNECILKELRFLLLWSNQLVGQVPLALSNSTKLKWLDLESNMLSGTLPSEIVHNWPQLQFLYFSYNDFVSHDDNTNLEPFFASLMNLSNLQVLELAGNNLGGKLPHIIGNLPTSLQQLHLEENLIYGSIPQHISNLVNLTFLKLSSNLINGSIPPGLCQMGRLERIYLSNNSLHGEIPSTLGDIQHLGLLDLSRNKLSGSIPDSFANLPQLRRLLLYDNQLSGTIPPSLGKCVNLEILDLSHNKITGMIPAEVAALTSLKLYLNLSSNDLHGPLPFELSKMDMVLAIDVSKNNLSGRIPPQLESCIALEYLNLSGNSLEGPLPDSLGQLLYIQALDVSSNQLTGIIPGSLQLSSSLKKLNFSFNKFSGNVSNKGAFSSFTIDSFLGNDGLCGPIKGMQRCHNKKLSYHLVFLLLPVLLFGTPLLCMVKYSMVRKRLAIVSSRSDLEDEEEEETKELKFPRISYTQLREATGGFSASSLIGSGRFGRVYKGVLLDNTRVAVKVLDTTASEISRSFRRECQILKKIRHRNLIRIITICSKPEFKALVLPLMSNGSLERHLYPSDELSQRLDMVQLVKICSDVAEGMSYLHHFSPFKVVHCDLKPSNILLDDDLTALVTDFGIARLLKSDESTSISDTASFSSTNGFLCGSLGYIAPEYGMGKHASTEGDVYSFGVLVLEIVTGRRPTDVLIHEGSSLHEWVKRQYSNSHKLENIVEQALQRFSPSGVPSHHNKILQDVILELVELGLLCTQHNPSTRPSMLDVAQEMGMLKDYLTNSTFLLIEDDSKINSFCSEDNLVEK
ncbi:putative leucine-rich repeat receptor-like serine/threonine-protein kinase At2g24130 [Gastrolobium bilobum]|uniref:putative leucine-rich repeat receptor-like serine/threonine-protein kinase At2g24130 n=1 Tax=Gastrolobium bilobum TaxID=150636 RepID=UPI002AB20735|nr:putative leucine-rich repeat receptor-like serine/threonine-protein kinase At2g24130 [Gastrolobium bilobum]